MRTIVSAAQELAIKPRGDRWCHLSLCVIDAVFSIGARYGSTWRAARRYADHAKLVPVTAPAEAVAAGAHTTTEESLSAFSSGVSGLPDDEFADLLGNRQRTSSRGGVLKAQAVREYAGVLAAHHVGTLGAVSGLLANTDRLKAVESDLARVRGHGAGVRVPYLWMLAGDDHHVKADRMVIAWTNRALGRPLHPTDASRLIIAAAAALGVTPWELDHAIWSRQRGRAPSAPS